MGTECERVKHAYRPEASLLFQRWRSMAAADDVDEAFVNLVETIGNFCFANPFSFGLDKHLRREPGDFSITNRPSVKQVVPLQPKVQKADGALGH